MCLPQETNGIVPFQCGTPQCCYLHASFHLTFQTSVFPIPYGWLSFGFALAGVEVGALICCCFFVLGVFFWFSFSGK